MEISYKTQKIIAITCGAILCGLFLLLALRNFNFAPVAQTSQTQQNIEQSSSAVGNKDVPADPTSPTANTNDFSFTTVAGDSYTLLARSAIQQYATAHNLQLTDAQVLLAEATLASNAGSPLLDIGQQVTIRQSDVAAVLGISTNGDAQKADATASSTNSNATPATGFSFTAVAGDSYITLARTAISDYASNNKLNLTGAQRMAAETSLVTAAGFPELTIGQNVTFSVASLKNAIASAKALPADQLAIWQSYASLAGM